VIVQIGKKDENKKRFAGKVPVEPTDFFMKKKPMLLGALLGEGL